jgi:uncharacterized membrane protein YphA (DoxX/SURF4 family)
MPTTYPIHSASAAVPATESQILHSCQLTLRAAFGIVPIVAGLDKFTNFLTNWEQYLNPVALHVVPLSATTFMHLVGIIEVIAGALVLAKPRLGAFIVMGWMWAIAAQLLVGWMYVDVAVRDLVISLGALTLARLTPIVNARENALHP